MPNTEKGTVSMSGSTQSVTIPAEFHFRSAEVAIRRNRNGDVILSEIPNLADVFVALDAANLPHDFMSEADRDRRPPQDRLGLDQLFDDDASEDNE